MEKPVPPLPPIANAADYIDSLSRPPAPDKPAKHKLIEGRRMRDKFLGKVAVPDHDLEEHQPS
ncbi:MAG: hypothetical protein ABI619_01660 [Betaproteobacteria bacterium]